MKLRSVVESAVQELFAKLLAKPEGEWMVVTLTKGRTTAGRKAIFQRLQQMCVLMQIEFFKDDVQFRICKGMPNEWKAQQQANVQNFYKTILQGKGPYQLPRQAGKTAAVQQILRSMNKPLPKGKP